MAVPHELALVLIRTSPRTTEQGGRWVSPTRGSLGPNTVAEVQQRQVINAGLMHAVHLAAVEKDRGTEYSCADHHVCSPNRLDCEQYVMPWQEES